MSNLPLHRLRLLVRPLVPRRLHHAATKALLHVASLALRGDAVACPCCSGTFRRFLVYPGLFCPRCGSYERHRLLCLYLDTRADLLSRPLAVLHVAPEEFLRRRFFCRDGIDYVSIDLEYPQAMLKMDVTRMSFEDDRFDFVLCNAVLEVLVGNERDALRELLRVLKPSGLMLLPTPAHARADKAAFERLLEEAGFRVEVERYAQTLGPALTERHGLDPAEDLYLCRKPAVAA